MDTTQPQHDLDYPPTDPAFDALLDQAVAQGAPAPDADLADRVYQHTRPMLPAQRPVLARIGPSLLRAAAAIALVAGSLIAFNLDTDTSNSLASSDLESLKVKLAELDEALDASHTAIDQQLDVLALRVTLADTSDAWGDNGITTTERIDRAIADYEFDRFSDDATFALAENDSWF